MSRFQIDLATHEDDAALRHVLASTPMEGRISVSFRREPSYFGASVVDGRFRQIGVARDLQAGGAIAGFACRSIRDVYLNGAIASVGYLSNLRALPEYRRRSTLVARAFRFLRQLHEDGRALLYLTTIAEGNDTALAVLTRGRAGLPMYHFAGRFHTAAIPLSRKPKTVRFRMDSTDVRRAESGDRPLLVDFLQREGSRRQFFPAYRAEDFGDPEGLLRGLRISDVLLAFRQERLVGTLAAWDQRPFRQVVVHAYSRYMRLVRPLHAAWAALSRRAPLPRVGEAFRYLTAALPVVADDDGAVFDALIRALLAAHAGTGNDCLLMGLHEDDPLLDTLRSRRAVWYTTRVYHVCWPDGEGYRATLDERPHYLELGSL